MMATLFMELKDQLSNLISQWRKDAAIWMKQYPIINGDQTNKITKEQQNASNISANFKTMRQST